MNKHEKNIAIAKILGFKILEDGQVIYPEDWEEYRSSVPCRNIPDFIYMFEQVKFISREFRYGIKRAPSKLKNH
jgi:hypothetical protein